VTKRFTIQVVESSDYKLRALKRVVNNAIRGVKFEIKEEEDDTLVIKWVLPKPPFTIIRLFKFSFFLVVK